MADRAGEGGVPGVIVSLSIDYPMAASLDKPPTGTADLVQKGSAAVQGTVMMRKLRS